MTQSETGQVLAFVGPSGVGKDTVMAALARTLPRARLVQRVVTRPQTAGGEDHVAVHDEQFDRMVTRGAFALHWKAHGLQYGIPVDVLSEMARGRLMLVNLSRSVLMEAQGRFDKMTVIHLTAPRAVLKARLAQRGRESMQVMEDRVARADTPLPRGLHDVVQVSNAGLLADTVAQVRACLQPERA